MDISQYQIDEIYKCAEDPAYFIEKYCVIQHPIFGDTPFLLTPGQRHRLDCIIRCKTLIIEKQRQIGNSTLLSAYFLWHSLFTSYSLSFFGSQSLWGSGDARDATLLMYDRLPPFLKLDKMDYGKRGIGFQNGSNILFDVVNLSTVRGHSLTLVYLDEAAYYRESSLEEFWNACKPALLPGAKIIVASSIEGARNTFFNVLHSAYPKVYLGSTLQDIVMAKLRGSGDELSISTGEKS